VTHYTVWQDLTEKMQVLSLFGFPFSLIARRDTSVKGKYQFFIQVLFAFFVIRLHFSVLNSDHSPQLSR